MNISISSKVPTRWFQIKRQTQVICSQWLQRKHWLKGLAEIKILATLWVITLTQLSTESEYDHLAKRNPINFLTSRLTKVINFWPASLKIKPRAPSHLKFTTRRHSNDIQWRQKAVISSTQHPIPNLKESYQRRSKHCLIKWYLSKTQISRRARTSKEDKSI